MARTVDVADAAGVVGVARAVDAAGVAGAVAGPVVGVPGLVRR
ncbi:hypothetical protein QCN29_12655 [Streptomyces sp. HNM0663]|uniref:Uncharacterized protein n=1 Tax=Streptomyces chengmaiensis TaxID=3040919 RepID=A0ABT6HMX4_9ACTN|nr:hypothetical protein [Streptomyces chengmaiensis]MDH2389628.1 hypothetical protein [Streptomyces chengmaiensis]